MRGRGWVPAAVIAALAAMPAAAAGSDASLAQVQSDAEKLSGRLKDLEARLALVEAQYGRKVSIHGLASADEKLAEGQIYFALAESSRDTKNYERAAIILFDLVENGEAANRSGYDDALHALAESLFQMKMRYGARTYFRKLADRDSRRYREKAIVRLIELAALLDNYDGLDEYYRRYEQFAKGDIKPTVRYARGKLLLTRHRYPDAEAELSKVPISDVYGVRALYLRSVGLLKQGLTDDALARFNECGRAQPVAPEDRQVIELAHMARGRLYYELGQLAESADAYQDIQTDSTYFSDMLYEVSWTFVKRGQGYKDQPGRADAEFGKALQALDLLLIADTNKKLESEVRLLRGNLLLRLSSTAEDAAKEEKYRQADTAFQEVVDTYSPTLASLEVQMAQTGNAEAILQELMRKDAKSVKVDSVLPPLVQKWAQGDETVADAITVYSDIEVTKVEVVETRELADKLLKFVDAPNRMDLFPALQEGRARSLSLENSLIELAGFLLDLENKTLGAVAELPTASDFRNARDARRALHKKLITLPKTEQDMSARRDRMTGKIAEVEKALFAYELEIDKARGQLAAMDVQARDKKVAGALSPAEEEYWKSELGQMSGALEQMLAIEKEIKTLLREEKESLGVAGGTGSQEGLIRAQYREAMVREAAAVALLSPAAPAEAQVVLPSLEARRQVAERMLARLDAFNADIKQQVDAQGSEMRGVIMLERTRVDEYEREIGAYEGEASEMASTLTHNALKGVRDQFYEVVLRADVGLIDVSWQEKQDRTENVNLLVRKQKTELKTLDDEFSEVLKDFE